MLKKLKIGKENMNKKSIMVDMDDVITTGGFLYLINKYLNTNYTEEDFQDFYMQDIISDKEAFFKWFKNYNMYDYSTFISDVKEVLEDLSKKYEIFIGTSYIIKDIIKDTGFLLEQKYNFLVENFPFINPYNIVFLGNKSVINCDIKIDDRIENLDGAKTKLLFTAWHNKNISQDELDKKGITRVNNWKEIKDILLKDEVTT